MLETIPHVKEKNPDAEFLLVGPLILGSVSSKTRDKLKQYIEKKYTQVTGEVPFQQAMEYLMESSIGWIPILPTLNYQHAKFIKIFEYALYGKPIVASRIGFIADLIEEMECGVLVDPFDAMDHARAINYLLEHRKVGALDLSAVNTCRVPIRSTRPVKTIIESSCVQSGVGEAQPIPMQHDIGEKPTRHIPY